MGDKKRRRVSLRIRFTLLVIALLVLAFVVIDYFLFINAQSSDIRNINQETIAFSNVATPQIGETYDIYKDSGSIRVISQIQSYTDLNSNIKNVTIVGLNGNSVLQINPSIPIQPVNAQNNFNTQYSYTSSGLISQIVVPYFDSTQEHPYSIAYQINTKVVGSDNEHQIKSIIGFSVLGLLLSAAFMYELIKFFYIKPIEEMSRQATIISQGNYDHEINLSRNDEIGDLAQSVNTLNQKLRSDIVKLREEDKLKSEFITITSHNLRTPLAIIKGNVEIMHARELPKEVDKPIREIEKSSNELASFAEDMLAISSIEAGQTSADKESISLEALTVPLKERFTGLAAEKGISLHWQIEHPEVIVNISTNYTRGALNSLLDNAIKFTNQGGVIFQARVKDKVLTIVVQDTGIGINDEEKSKLFTKFHRGTSDLQYNYEGTGIGLYVSKLMVEIQNGKIQLDSQPGKGSTFTITIPVK